jgi:hypothetical protein
MEHSATAERQREKEGVQKFVKAYIHMAMVFISAV